MGTYIAYRITNSEKHYHIAKITDITDGIATIWHMSTTSTNIRTANWNMIYLKPKSNIITVKKPKVLNADTLKLCSKLTTISLQTMIVMTNVGLKQNKLTFQSIQKLKKSKLKHHVYRKTWNYKNLIVFDQA